MKGSSHNVNNNGPSQNRSRNNRSTNSDDNGDMYDGPSEERLSRNGKDKKGKGRGFLSSTPTGSSSGDKRQDKDDNESERAVSKGNVSSLAWMNESSRLIPISATYCH
jgi:hypothetical protein